MKHFECRLLWVQDIVGDAKSDMYESAESEQPYRCLNALLNLRS